MKPIYIPVYLFSGFMGYCEIKIINHYKLGISPKITKATIIGKKIHQDLEEADKLIPRETATEQQLKNPYVDLDFPREETKIVIDRSPFIYIGRIDKCIRLDGNVVIIDDKVSKSGKVFERPFMDKILQLSCYCEGFLNGYSNLLVFNKIFFKVVQRDIDGNVISEYEEEYNEKLRNLLIGKFQRFEDIYNQKIQPEHCNNANKCRACSYFHGCKWRLE